MEDNHIEESPEFFDLVSPEELQEYQRLKNKIERAVTGQEPSTDPISDPSYYYDEKHPEYVYRDVTHLFINVSTELHHTNEEMTELTNIQQINSIQYHVVVKPGMDPINLSKDFLDTLDKSLDTSYVNIEEHIKKNPLDKA